MEKAVVEIYTDGACSGNPGPGGWGAILCYDNHEKELSGFEAVTTNNRMEMKAAIEALKALEHPSKVKIITDSLYLKDGITLWLPVWKKRGWKKADQKPIKNPDLWQELDALREKHEIEWGWIRGHSGHSFNERADALARKEIVFYSIAQVVTP